MVLHIGTSESIKSSKISYGYAQEILFGLQVARELILSQHLV